MVVGDPYEQVVQLLKRVSTHRLRTAAVDASGARVAVWNNVTNLYFQKNTRLHLRQDPFPPLRPRFQLQASGSHWRPLEKYCSILPLKHFISFHCIGLNCTLTPGHDSYLPGTSEYNLLWKQGVLSWGLTQTPQKGNAMWRQGEMGVLIPRSI